MCNTVSEFVANINWWAGEPNIEALFKNQTLSTCNYCYTLLNQKHDQNNSLSGKITQTQIKV